jgi:peroxiredoxin
MKRLKAGDAVPDFDVKDIYGKPISASSLKGKPYMIVFSRYIGCPICKMHVGMMPSLYSEIKRAGGELLLLLRSDPDVLKKQFEKMKPEFHVIGDPDSRMYGNFGVRSCIVGYLAPGSLAGALKAIRSGYRHGKFERGELQMPADFVVSAESEILYAHYGKHSNDLSDRVFLLEELKRTKKQL